MNKSEYRKHAVKILKRIKGKQKRLIEKQFLEILFMSQLWKRAQLIGISISINHEWDTKPIITRAQKEGKLVAVPKCFPENHELKFYEFNSYEKLENVYYNLYEPNPNDSKYIEKPLIDLLIVPGLTFDKSGYRIGFGGGYYDRYLTDFHNKTVSLTSQSLLCESLPVASYDIPVCHLITEEGQIK